MEAHCLLLWGPTLLFQSGSNFWDKGSEVWEKTLDHGPTLCCQGHHQGLLTARPVLGFHLRFCRVLFCGHSLTGSPGLGALRVGHLSLTLHPVGVTRSYHKSEFYHLQNQGSGWDDPVSQGHL